MSVISATVITLNEEKNIERCLNSLKNVADEIIVVDSFSTDRTEEICRQFNVRFVQHKFEGYVEQRRFAASLAKYRMVLALDADEALSTRLQESIMEIRNDFRHDGYYANRRNRYCGKWVRFTSWYPDRKLRLWDRTKGCPGGTNPHDRVEMYEGTKTTLLKGSIEHYTFDTVSEHLAQVNRFTDTAAMSYYYNGRSAGVIMILVKPSWKFLREYIFKGGILDGYNGLLLSIIASFYVFLKFVKLRQINITANRAGGALVFFNSSRTWGGGEKWHYQTALKLSELGYPVHVVAKSRSDLHKRLKNKKLRVRQLNIGNLSFLNPFKLFRVYRYFKKERVGTVILNLSSDAKIGGIAAFLAGVGRIIYRRGLASPVRDSWLNRLLFRRVFTHIIANSEETKRMILVNNPQLVPEKKISVVPNWLEPSGDGSGSCSATVYYKRKGNELVLGNLGRMVEQKGQKLLLEAAFKLKSEGIDFSMIIGGAGKLEQELKAYAGELGLEREVIFTGFVKDTYSFIRSIDVFVLSSLYEGFGFVIAEAMSGGKPVIAFNTSSNPEIINDGENGYLVPPGDIEALVEKVKVLAFDKNMRTRIGDNGKKTVSERFSFDQQLPRLSDIFGLEPLDLSSEQQ